MKFKDFTDIENLRHAKVEEKPIKNYTGNIDELTCSKPSTNTSKATKAEMTAMQGMFKQRNEAIEQSVKNHDPKSEYAIEKYLKENNLDIDKTNTDKIAETGAAIARKFKNKFERARPYHLADSMKLDFNSMPLVSDSMKTPAYPSGHSLQSRLIGEYYAEKYPEHREGLIDAADECGMGRVYAGWHYPSDHKASVKMAQEIYPKINLNRKSFSESIIDIPRKTYAPGVFTKADTPNPELKPSVKKMVLDGIKTFEKFGKVVKYTLIGSILTKQYRADADLDVNILFDIPGSKAEQEKVHDEIREYQGQINGKTIPGTEHPINYFSIIDPATFNKARDMADGTFDIDTNKWIKKPEPGTFEPEKYVTDFQKRVSEIDVVKGELVRDMIDYEELKDLTSSDIDNLSTLVSKKLDEIKDSINTLIDIGDKTINDRKDAFSKDMSPDEIRKFGVKNRLPKNVIYKMLEKYHYLKFFKKLKEIMEDGKITPAELKSLSKIKEAKGRSIAFTFGRFNPPTIGHEKLINKVAQQRTDDYRIYLSKSEDTSKNPLNARVKLATMKQMFPRHSRNILLNPSNMILDIVTDLYKRGYSNITMVAGSDRVREFDTILKKYNGVKSRHGLYDFDSISVASAGERDPDAEGATGMSASKMRAAAKSKDFASFKKGLPSGFANSKNAQDLFRNVRKGMMLAASFDADSAFRFKPFITASTKEELDKMTLRDKYISEHLYDVGDIVDDMESNVTGVIVRRGTNYVTLEDEELSLHKCWLYNIMETPVYSVKLEERSMNLKEKRKLAYDKETDQPKKYVAGLSDKEKKAHDKHLEKQGKKSDSDKSAYKQSPADKVAKTKPSKHTKRFKQMYGELKTKSEKEPQHRGQEFNTDGIPESYEIGHDYAKYTSSITPGEKHYNPKYQGGSYSPSKHSDNLINVNAEKDISMKDNKKVELKDIEEWASKEETINKYKERYGEEWQSKIEETYNKMFNKVIDTNSNMQEGRMKEIAIDLKSKEEGGLDPEEFQRKYNKSKAEMRKDLGATEGFKLTFKDFMKEEADEWGIFPSQITEAEHQGKKVTLNKPVRGGSKKFYVYTKGPNDNVVKVSFGDPNMEIKKDNPARRKSFRARHNCDNPGPKWKARYWSCKKW